MSNLSDIFQEYESTLMQKVRAVVREELARSGRPILPERVYGAAAASRIIRDNGAGRPLSEKSIANGVTTGAVPCEGKERGKLVFVTDHLLAWDRAGRPSAAEFYASYSKIYVNAQK